MVEATTQTLGDRFHVRTVRDREAGYLIVEVERDGQIVEMELHEVAHVVDALMLALGV